MPNVGTITGSMMLDPSAYLSGLNAAAGATSSFQQGVSSISFAGFNRGMIASTTLMYAMGRVMHNMSKGMEEYSNLLGRIGSVADMTASSIALLADSMKSLSVEWGVSRKDIMGGMYVAAQAGYQTPAEMRAMSVSGSKLSRASGKEIDVKKSVDLMAGIRQAMGVSADAVSSNRMSDILLRGRDIGRWELDQMAHALGIPLTVWGNQFAGKQSGEETLRQLLSVMSVASLAGVSPNMTATGTRRIVEKTLQLNKSGRVGDPLRNALRGVGFNGPEPILEALNQGGIKYLNTLMGISGGGQTSELTRLGYGSRDLLVLTSALRGKGQKLNQTYEELSYGNAAGVTERYGQRMRTTYDYSRERLRAQWEITSQEFMRATIPLIGHFVTALESINRVAQALPDSVKSFMMFVAAMSSFRLALNLLGIRTHSGAAAGAGLPIMSGGRTGVSARSSAMPGNFLAVSPEQAQAARQARRLATASSRPYSRFLTPQASPMWGSASPISSSRPPSSLAALSWMNLQPRSGIAHDMRVEALRNRYVLGTPGGIPTLSSRYGPTVEQRIRWAAYKQGQSVDFATGAYGSLSPAAMAYASRGVPQGTQSLPQMRAAAVGYGGAYGGLASPIIANMRRQMEDGYATPGFSRQLGRYSGMQAGFSAAGIAVPKGAYASAGIGPAMQIVTPVLSTIGRFGSGLMGVLGPLAMFAVALKGVGSIYEALTYKAPGEVKEGGMLRMKASGIDYGIKDVPFRAMGFFAAALANRENLGDYTEEFARKYGAVADADGKGWSSFQAWKRTGQTALAGYRDVTMDDIMGIVAREQLSPSEVRRFSKGGVDFSKFSTAKGYLDEYVQTLGKKSPENWEKWVRETTGGIDKAAEYLADALKRAADKIASSASTVKPVGNFTSPWSASVYWMTGDAVTRQRLLAGRQWDIYSGADPTGRNGNLNWNAGGMDYRALYNQSLAEMGSNFGGFTGQSYSANARAAIESQRNVWKDKASRLGAATIGGVAYNAGAKFGGFEDDATLGMMLRDGDADFAKMKRMREFLQVMPDIGTMPEADAAAWFSKLTGRDPNGDAFARQNFQNFRGMDVGQFVSAEQVRPPVQYAQATQFGTAEAYNELLQRDRPEERIAIAFDKFANYIDTLTVKEEDVESELSKVTNLAKKFFEQPDMERFFENIDSIAENTGPDGV